MAHLEIIVSSTLNPKTQILRKRSLIPDLKHQVVLPFSTHDVRRQSIDESLTLKVHVLNNWALRVLVILNIVQVFGKSMIIRYFSPLG